jgi:hypothetical protein
LFLPIYTESYIVTTQNCEKENVTILTAIAL